ncbi:MAG: exodeoxyribonuclease V alpha subunit, partial [Myxococcota bacterium]
MSVAQLWTAARLAGLSGPESLRWLQPLLLAQVLEPVDLHVTAMLAARFGESDPAVLLAASLAIRAPRHGHVCVDLLQLESATLRPEAVRDVPQEDVELPEARQDWLDRVARSALVRAPGPGSTPLVLRGSLLYTDRYFTYEASLEQALRGRFGERRAVAHPKLLTRGLDALFGPELGEGEDRQRLAAQVAISRGVTVISGGPGTGKTWTVRNLLTLVYAQAVGTGDGTLPRIALAAPTGKAAARVVSSIRDGLDNHLARAAGALPEGAEVAGLRAFLEAAAPSTLHRLLGWRPDAPTRFRHDRSRPLPLDLLVVDEASMVDLALMAKLFDAVPATARVVLLGDRHQLASVEAGSVLGDVCGSGEQGVGPSEAVVFLTHSRRFRPDSGIGQFAAAAVSSRIDDAIAALPLWGAGEPGLLTPDAEGQSGGTLGRLES